MKSYTKDFPHCLAHRVAASADHRRSLVQGWKIVFCMLPVINGLLLLGTLLQVGVNTSNGKKRKISNKDTGKIRCFCKESVPLPELRREKQIP